MEIVAITIAALALVATAVQAYFTWKNHQGAKDAAEVSRAQAAAIAQQAVELRKAREVAESANKAAREATLRLAHVEKRRKTMPEGLEALPAPWTTDEIVCVVRNLGPAPASDIDARAVRVGTTTFEANAVFRTSTSALGPGEEATFVIDLPATLKAFQSLNGTKLNVWYRDGTGQRRETLGYP